MTEFAITQDLYNQLVKATLRSHIRRRGKQLFLECITCETTGYITVEDRAGELFSATCPDCEREGEMELVVEEVSFR